MFFGVSAGNIARTYTEQCVGILTELLGLQQEHITSGNHLQVVCLAYAFRKRPCWGSWSQTQGSRRHLAFNLIAIFRWKSSWWSWGYTVWPDIVVFPSLGTTLCGEGGDGHSCVRGPIWRLLSGCTCWLREWGTRQRHFSDCSRAKMINRSFKSLWFLFLI